jgi:uncharacterized protein YjbI with pentapeptide repeats
MANEEHLMILKKGIIFWNKWRKENPNIIPDLTKADLSGYDFGVLRDDELEAGRDILLEDPDIVNKMGNLDYVNFSRANLEAAVFDCVECYRAIFYGANLKYAYFDEVNLEATIFEAANLEDVNFIYSNLYKANLRNARVIGTFYGANLVEADLQNAKFLMAAFVNANLQGAIIDGVDFSNVRFENTTMPDGTIYTSSNE